MDLTDTLHSESIESNIDSTDPQIEETEVEQFPELEQDEVSQEDTEIEMTVDDCEMAYGVIMETAHAVIGTRNGAGHRGIPEDRRKAQGELLYSICQKYGIKIPTEFAVVMLGAAAVADWQYMTVKAGDTNVPEEPEEIDNSN